MRFIAAMHAPYSIFLFIFFRIFFRLIEPILEIVNDPLNGKNCF